MLSKEDCQQKYRNLMELYHAVEASQKNAQNSLDEIGRMLKGVCMGASEESHTLTITNLSEGSAYELMHFLLYLKNEAATQVWVNEYIEGIDK